MWLCAAAACLALLFASSAALAQASRSPSYIETQQAGVNARIEVLGQAFTSPYPIGADQSRIMLYRPAASRLSGATSVFVDDRYHTSLVPGAWSALCVDSLTKQSQASRSNMSHLVIDVLFQDCG